MAKTKKREVTCLPQIMSGLGVLFLLVGLPLLVMATLTLLTGTLSVVSALVNAIFAFFGWVVEKAGILLAGWILLMGFSKR